MESNCYQVIVIGAGISGIGASKTLTESNVPHLLIECRDRIGGRIHSTEFDGVRVELGASFVHSPKNQGNLISKFVEGANWGKLPGKFGSESYYFQNEGLMKMKHVQKAGELYEQMDQYIEEMMEGSNQDRSVQEVAQEFFKKRVGRQAVQVRKIFESMMDYNSNVEGGDLNQLSLKEYLEDETETIYDFLPEGGYSKIVSTLFGLCNSQLKLGEKVLKIDYSGEMVRVVTDKETYRCRYIIGSLPLGVLQARKVEFVPQMPQTYDSNIQKMGNGVVNKIYVSFEKPFWGNRKGYINFVTKTKINRYPVAFVMSEKNRHILCLFVSAGPCVELMKWTNQEILADLKKFLKKFQFQKEEIKIREFTMTRWHQQQESLGSYSFGKVGHDQEKCSELLRKPIGGKVWLVGEHLHPTMNACAHAAYETGVWAGAEVAKLMQETQ